MRSRYGFDGVGAARSSLERQASLEKITSVLGIQRTDSHERQSTRVAERYARRRSFPAGGYWVCTSRVQSRGAGGISITASPVPHPSTFQVIPGAEVIIVLPLLILSRICSNLTNAPSSPQRLPNSDRDEGPSHQPTIMTQIPAGKSTGGVLQIPVAATQKNTSATPKKAPKPAAPRLKLIVRRLPPGLTQAEFETALGPEWRIGGGKVDWFQYKPGKISKE